MQREGDSERDLSQGLPSKRGATAGSEVIVNSPNLHLLTDLLTGGAGGHMPASRPPCLGALLWVNFPPSREAENHTLVQDARQSLP